MGGMDTSILEDVKKLLGVPKDYEAFDTDIIININSALSTLLQLGIGPSDGFYINGSKELWSDLIIREEDINKFFFVKQYVYLSVRLIFDPPSSSFVLNAYKDQLNELTWRLNVMEETFRKEEIDSEEF